MSRTISSIPFFLAGLAILGIPGCGGDGGGNGVTDPTPDPEPVALVELDPLTSEIEVAETVQLTATLKDAAGNLLTNRTVTWASTDQGVASVSSAGLVTGAGKGSATITATSEGKNGTAALTVQFADFTPQQNTTLAGAVTYNEVNIPDGVTVTLTGDLALTAEGPITIQGDLTGDCAALTITGAGNVALTGDITNSCTDTEAEGADITVVADGDLTIGGTWTSSGNTELSNDPTLTDADFELSAPGAGSLPYQTIQCRGILCRPGFLDPGSGRGEIRQETAAWYRRPGWEEVEALMPRGTPGHRGPGPQRPGRRTWRDGRPRIGGSR